MRRFPQLLDARHMLLMHAALGEGQSAIDAYRAWRASETLELSLSGFNLLHDHHQEYPAPAGAVPRSLLAEVRWRF